MNLIGKAIREARERQHLTQQELAQKLRVGIQTIENYETGEQIPSNQTILRLSTVLDIPASELLRQHSNV